MSLIIDNLNSSYEYLLRNVIEYEDSRIGNWPLLAGSPWNVILVLVAYVFFIRIGGPAFMRYRKPYNLQNTIMAYNIFQILINFGMATYSIFRICLSNEWNWMCQPVIRTVNNDTRVEMFMIYGYFMLKVLDLMDTVFFVLRKKYRQITFLHVYHHVVLVLGTYLLARTGTSGHTALVGIINEYVHVIMYSYYLFSGLQWNVVWMKKHITRVQILQFALVMIHMGRPLVMQDCNYSNGWLLFFVAQSFMFIILFTNFYVKTYFPSSKVLDHNENKIANNNNKTD